MRSEPKAAPAAYTGNNLFVERKVSPSRDQPLLFTPGPLTTSSTVKQAMSRDVGSRDLEFIGIVREIRQRLLALGSVATPDYECVIMQGSGTGSVESVISSAVAAGGRLLVVANGAYGQRMVQIANAHRIETVALTYSEEFQPDLYEIDAALTSDPAITHVAVVHLETTTGLINPIKALGDLVTGKHKRRFIVDAMSSFGGIPIDVAGCGIDFIVSSANKCVEGVPGFGFVLAKRDALLECEGRARSLVLDLFAQWRGLEGNGQFRFTPPTHALLAFYQALDELDAEGGIAGRAARYFENYKTLVAGMRELGFREYLAPENQGGIIVSFLYPSAKFNFDEFYRQLSDSGFVIYPGKVSNADCFRIGCIGRIFPTDIRELLAAIEQTKEEMGF